MSDYYFIAFESTNYALSAEDYLKNNNCNITIIPTPREVSASCGLSIKFNSEDIDMIKRSIDSGFIKVKGIYRRKDESGIGRIIKVG
jgi:hypothetical protein